MPMAALPLKSSFREQRQVQRFPAPLHKRTLQTQCISFGFKTQIVTSESVRTGLAATLAALTLLSSSPALARETIVGHARVIDGDTIVLNGSNRIRLFGIDAPESAQSCSRGPSTSSDTASQEYQCGIFSKEALEKKIGNSIVACEVKRKDIYGRDVAICSLATPTQGATPEDLNAWMVEQGYAVAYRRYSKMYSSLEDSARAAKKGIWSGAFEEPEAWRKEHPRGFRGSGNTNKTAPSVVAVAPLTSSAKTTLVVPKKQPAPSSDCLIKGNINQKREKIYHVPGGSFYDRVQIDKKGERWFCSEEEALAAGWRASK